MYLFISSYMKKISELCSSRYERGNISVPLLCLYLAEMTVLLSEDLNGRYISKLTFS